jgi:hypothetical protein
MIVGKDIHPERKIYYLGARLIELLKDFPGKEINFFDIYQKLNESEKVSIKLFTLTLDWLFLLKAIDSRNGNIEKCF